MPLALGRGTPVSISRCTLPPSPQLTTQPSPNGPNGCLIRTETIRQGKWVPSLFPGIVPHPEVPIASNPFYFSQISSFSLPIASKVLGGVYVLFSQVPLNPLQTRNVQTLGCVAHTPPPVFLSHQHISKVVEGGVAFDFHFFLCFILSQYFFYGFRG